MMKMGRFTKLVTVVFVLLLWAGRNAAEENSQINTEKVLESKKKGQVEQTLREMDFAYGRMIQLGSESPLYRFSLDTHVYRHVANERLLDLRIFNHQKERVPLRIKTAQVPKFKKFQAQKLPIFPLFVTRDSAPGDLTLNLKSNSTETNFSLTISGSKDPSVELSGFIVDLGEEAKTPERLKVTLNGGRQEYRLAAKVAYSNDLSSWQDLLSGVALVKMAFNGQHLERNRIDLPPFSGRYLRISFQTPYKGAFRADITGFYPITPFIPKRRRTIVKGRRTSAQPLIFNYDSEGYFPTDRIQLQLPHSNSLIKARLSTRSNPESPWNYRKTVIFYHLRVDGAKLENAPIVLQTTQDRFFRLEILAGSLSAGSKSPDLVLMWHPHECAFVASGDPPFMLAYGNADLRSEPQVVDDLLEAISQKHQKRYMGFSRLDYPQVLGGDERLKSTVDSKEGRLRVILWAVLCISVLGLALMAYQLYCRMKPEAEQHP